jgi:hypothetical protein
MRRRAPCWAQSFFPLARWNTVDPRAVQAVLRGWFTRWGLPVALRVDNGPPWGSGHDLPPALALWLWGLGIEVVWNRPRRCTDNAVIERAHGVCQRWVEPATCADLAAVQARLDHFTTVQRELYPLPSGQSRWATYPALATTDRPYDPAAEGAQWDVTRVWTALAAHVQRRRVDQVGRISLYNRAVGVGRAWAGTTVTVQLAWHGRQPVWVIRAADGTCIREQPAPELLRGRIRRLTVAHHRPRRQGANPHDHQGAELYGR